MRQQLTVTQYYITYITYTQTVNQYVTSRYFTSFTSGTALNFHNLTDFSDENVLRLNANGFCQKRMFALHTVFTVNWNEIFWFHQVEHKLKLFLATVTGYVNARIGTAINYVSAKTEQFINGTTYIFLVTWYRCCCNNNSITWQDIYFTMTGTCHTGQCGHWLALGSCAKNNDTVRCHSVHFFRLDQHTVWYVQISKLRSDGYNVYHTTTNYCNLTTCGFCCINHLLNAVHIGSKSCYNDTLFSFAENVFQNDTDIFLRWGKAWFLSICTIRQKSKHALLTNFSHPMQICKLTVDWSVVKFEISRMNYVTFRCFYAYTDGIRNTVIGSEECNFERTSQLNFGIFIDQNSFGVTQ
ncbi:hypothetical protein D3C78_850680 [compost metagenome]